MKMRNAGKLLFRDAEHRLDIQFSPEVRESGLGFDPYDRTMAQFLVSLAELYEGILSVRQVIQLPDVCPYPHNPTVADLVKLIFSVISPDRYDDFRERVISLRNRYRLPENWQLSFQIAVLTDTILIPHQDSGIRVYFPESEKSNGRHRKPFNALQQSRKIIENMRQNPTYPGIYFTRQDTIDELKGWINQNKDLVRSIQHNLPIHHVIKTERKVLFWGQMAWIVRSMGETRWQRIEGIFDDIFKKQYDHGVEDNDEVTGYAPSYIDLQKCYYSYLETVKTIFRS